MCPCSQLNMLLWPLCEFVHCVCSLCEFVFCVTLFTAFMRSFTVWVYSLHMRDCSQGRLFTVDLFLLEWVLFFSIIRLDFHKSEISQSISSWSEIGISGYILRQSLLTFVYTYRQLPLSIFSHCQFIFFNFCTIGLCLIKM